VEHQRGYDNTSSTALHCTGITTTQAGDIDGHDLATPSAGASCSWRRACESSSSSSVATCYTSAVRAYLL
jgi:hypothetical protein